MFRIFSYFLPVIPVTRPSSFWISFVTFSLFSTKAFWTPWSNSLLLAIPLRIIAWVSSSSAKSLLKLAAKTKQKKLRKLQLLTHLINPFTIWMKCFQRFHSFQHIRQHLRNGLGRFGQIVELHNFLISRRIRSTTSCLVIKSVHLIR